jgi:hypothetical protein
LLLVPGLPGQPQPAPKLNIVIVDGEGANNNIRLRTAREPIVQVEDENHKPVAGAAVVFTLPERGASGSFGNAQSLSVVTNEQGRAVAQGLRPNTVAGRLEIRVDASYQGRTGQTVIHQRNVKKAKGMSAKTWLIVAAVIAAATVGGICGSGNCSGGGARTGTVITPGGGTVGAPH